MNEKKYIYYKFENFCRLKIIQFCKNILIFNKKESKIIISYFEF